MGRMANALGFIRFDREEAVAAEYVQRLGIRTPSTAQTVRLLSGGNQQKVVIAKWLLRARVIFFDEPTRHRRGAKHAIYELMDQLAAEGRGVVLISSDLPGDPRFYRPAWRPSSARGGSPPSCPRETTQEEIMRHASVWSTQAQPAQPAPEPAHAP